MQRSDRSGSNNGSSTHRTCTRGEGRRAMQEGEKRALKKLRMGAKLTRKELRGGLRVPQNSRRNEPRSKRRLEERAHYYFVSFFAPFPQFLSSGICDFEKKAKHVYRSEYEYHR